MKYRISIHPMHTGLAGLVPVKGNEST